MVNLLGPGIHLSEHAKGTLFFGFLEDGACCVTVGEDDLIFFRGLGQFFPKRRQRALLEPLVAPHNTIPIGKVPARGLKIESQATRSK